MKKTAIMILLGIQSIFIEGQTLPTINADKLPNDSDPICSIPFYTGSFEVSGYQKNQYVPDFTVFDRDGKRFNLKEELAKGKPVFIMGGNITCPVFRDQIKAFNDICQKYSGQISPIVLYGIEAHPDIDTSVYFGRVQTGARNINDNILYRQPTNYDERKTLVDELLKLFSISAPVYLDQPCNEWWTHFGPAPNNSYLINTDGSVFAKHGWFNRFPANMACSIDTLLGLPSSCSGGSSSNGTFQFKSFGGEDTASDITGSTLYAKGTIKNNSKENVIVEISRQQQVLPLDWSNSMCIIQCLPPEDDTTIIELLPNQTEIFSVDFYSSSTPGTAKVSVKFRNVNNSSNILSKWFVAETNAVSYVSNLNKNTLQLYPNPVQSDLKVVFNENLKGQLEIRSIAGVVVFQKDVNDQAMNIDTHLLADGLYLMTFIGEGGTFNHKFVIQHH